MTAARPTRIAGALLLVLALPVLAACLRTGGPRPRAEEKRMRRVVPGISTTAEVRAALGPPNVKAGGDTWIYEWQTTEPALILGTGSFGGPEIPVGPVHSFTALVSFDAAGRVARYEVQSDPPALAARLGAASPVPYTYLRPTQSLERAGCGERRCRPTRLAADGQWAVSPQAGALRLWRVGSEALPRELGRFHGEDGHVALSADGALAVWALPGGQVTVVATDAAAELARIDSGTVTALALNAAGNRLALATAHGELLLHAVDRGRLVARATLPGPDVHALAYSPTDPLVAAVDDDDSLLLMTEDGASVRRVVPGRRGRYAPRRVGFSPDGRHLAVTGEIHVEIHAVESLAAGGSTPVQVLLLPVGGASGGVAPRAVFDRNGRLLAVVSAGDASVWEWPRANLLAILESPGASGPLRPAVALSDLAFRADGLLLTAGAGPIHEWDPAAADPRTLDLQRN